MPQGARDLGVGIAGELDADGLQLSAQCCEVLDDPVVDDRDLACGVAVRVGVAVGGPAMRGPTGVAEAGAAHEAGVVGFGEIGFEVGEPARPAVHGQPPLPSISATPDESCPRYPCGAARPR
jgi:hypothetical protein